MVSSPADSDGRPGGDSIGAFSGKKSDALITTDAMWTFFAAHARAD